MKRAENIMVHFPATEQSKSDATRGLRSRHSRACEHSLGFWGDAGEAGNTSVYVVRPKESAVLAGDRLGLAAALTTACRDSTVRVDVVANLTPWMWQAPLEWRLGALR